MHEQGDFGRVAHVEVIVENSSPLVHLINAALVSNYIFILNQKFCIWLNFRPGLDHVQNCFIISGQIEFKNFSLNPIF